MIGRLYIAATKDGPVLVEGDNAADAYLRAGVVVERVTETKTMTRVGMAIEEQGATIHARTGQKRGDGHG